MDSSQKSMLLCREQPWFELRIKETSFILQEIQFSRIFSRLLHSSQGLDELLQAIQNLHKTLIYMPGAKYLNLALSGSPIKSRDFLYFVLSNRRIGGRCQDVASSPVLVKSKFLKVNFYFLETREIQR